MSEVAALPPGAVFAGLRHSGLKALGRRLSPALVRGTAELLAPGHRAIFREGAVTKDVPYGDDPRQRMDVHAPESAGPAAAIVVYVHGGGFVAGDKRVGEGPFYGNVGAWAASIGHVGVVMTYRLAPDATWPAGAEDVLAATRVARSRFGGRSGDAPVVVIGQSAGAAHVATAISLERRRRLPSSFAGAVMLSGIFDPALLGDTTLRSAYYGSDRKSYGVRSALTDVVLATVPCLFTISEFDPLEFQRQAVALVRGSISRRGRWPQLITLMEHNHVSPGMSIGLEGDPLSDLLDRFVGRCAASGDRSLRDGQGEGL